MTVLLTGGAGYIGSHTCVEFLKDGYDIVVVDDLSNSNIKAVERVQQISGREFPFYEADVRDEAKMEEICAAHDIGAVVHFAGFKAVGESVRKPLEYYDNNINTTMTLCRVMKKRDIRRFIFSSSATVYRGDNPMPLTEAAQTGCINPYGWTKYMCEQILSDMAVAQPDWAVCLLRYFNPIGAHESGLIGEDPSGIPNNLMPYISQTAIGRLEKLHVYGDDYDTEDGTGIRDYIHVVDLARGHVAALRYCEQRTGTVAVNLGTGIGTSVLEMVRAFENASGVTVPYVIDARRPGDLPVCYASAEKAARLFGWKAEKNLADMCADTWRWQKNNPKGYA